MVFLFIISVVVTVAVWSRFGPVWGLVTGFLLIGGTGWKLLLVIPGLLMAPFRPGWAQFVKAWEKRLGDERRSGFDVPDAEVLTMREAYRAWRQNFEATRISAAGWLDERAEWFERRGFLKPPQEGETKITSEWRYDIWAFDDRGEWSEFGAHFAAVRTFEFEVGGPLGSATSYTHAENCMHSHKSRNEAMPCLANFRQLGGSPSLDDLKPKKPLLTASGVYREGDSGEQHEGQMEAWDFGITVPKAWEGKRLLFDWEQLRGVSRMLAGIHGLVLEIVMPTEQTGSPSEIELLNLDDEEEAAWMQLLRDRGVAEGIDISDRQAFTAALKEELQAGRWRPSPSLAIHVPATDLPAMPPPPVSDWQECPHCGGDLVQIESAMECLGCRWLWCDAEKQPRLDDSGKLVGIEPRLVFSIDLESGDYLKVWAFIRPDANPPQP